MRMVRVVQYDSVWNEPRQPRKPSQRSERRGSLRASVAPLPQCLRRRGTAERRSPFQSARDSRPGSRFPGGLKGRGRVREARRRKHRNEVRSAASRATGAGRGLSRHLRRGKRKLTQLLYTSPVSNDRCVFYTFLRPEGLLFTVRKMAMTRSVHEHELDEILKLY